MNNIDAKLKNDSYVLITGASSGIGFELAKLFASDKFNIILTARRKDVIDDLAKNLHKEFGVDVKTYRADLSEEKDRLSLISYINKEKLKIGTLVNNAGFGDWGPFAESDWEKDEKMISLNITALTHLIKLVIPHMEDLGVGKILNLGSIAGFIPGPYMAAYFASKAYVLSLSKALSVELKEKNIHVSVLCPGPTKTGFRDVSGMKNTKFFDENVMKVEDVAQYGYDKFMCNKEVIVPGIKNKISVFLPRILPTKLITAIISHAQGPTK